MPGIISQLRDIMPIRALTFIEASRIAELQASKLLALKLVTEGPVSEAVIADLPHVQVERMTPAPFAGASQWTPGRWRIVINGAHSEGRQRFSLAHELKHILDNPFIHLIYPSVKGMSDHDRAEQICDYFAACLLMPRPWVKSAWVEGCQELRPLSRRFGVSQQAMYIRLLQLGLIEPVGRCGYVTPQRVPTKGPALKKFSVHR
jgi:predicted transcriptional regulator